MYQEMIFQTTGAQYMTEDLFTSLGFYTGSASKFMIDQSFFLAERQVAQEINTYLTPTTVTGSMSNFKIGENIFTPVGKLISVDSVTFKERTYEGQDRLISGTAFITDPFFGAFRVSPSPYDNSIATGAVSGITTCREGNYINPNLSHGVYTAEIVYTAGYQSGTWNNPDITQAIAMASDLILKMLADEGGLDDENGSFIKSYSVGRYSQTISDRWAKTTRFGYSGKAQFISNLLEQYKIRKAGKLGL
jgi:hypothetical protein